MLRTSSSILGRLAAHDLRHGNTVFALEFVRWRTKPRWVPIAKSKIFKVPERKKQPEDERLELLRLNNIYKTQLRSVRLYLREEAKRVEETSSADHFVLTPEQEEAEFGRALQLNAEWNAKIAAEREQRLAKERADRAALIKERLEMARIREEEQYEETEALVRKTKELAKAFITRENLDAAIDCALANPTDYNFSIDLQGNIYRGRTTTPGSSGAPATTTSNVSDPAPPPAIEEDKKLEARN